MRVSHNCHGLCCGVWSAAVAEITHWVSGAGGGLAGCSAGRDGRCGRGGGGAPGPGADGFEQVVAGGPQVQFEVGFGIPVVQVAAEAGEQLGEDRFDDAGSLPVEGFAFGGIEPGGHVLPRFLHRGGFVAIAQPPSLAGFLGDGDVQLGLTCGGEVVFAGVPGVKQCLADRVAEASGVQVGAACLEQGVQGAAVGGVAVGADGVDDLVPAGQGLYVVQLIEPAFLGGHDTAGRVGRAGLGRLARPGGGRGGLGLRQGLLGLRGGGPLPADHHVAVRRYRDPAVGALAAPGGGLGGGAGLVARHPGGRDRLLPRGSGLVPPPPSGPPSPSPSPNSASSASSAAWAWANQASTSAASSASSSPISTSSCAAVALAAIDALALTFVPSPATTSTLTRPCAAHATSDWTSSPFTAVS